MKKTRAGFMKNTKSLIMGSLEILFSLILGVAFGNALGMTNGIFPISYAIFIGTYYIYINAIYKKRKHPRR